MSYLLDTNVASEPSRPAPNPAVLTWLDEHQADCFLSTISLAEMRYGIERLADTKRRRELEAGLRYLLEELPECCLDFGPWEAAEWGRYAAELEALLGDGWLDQVDLRDSLIAAVARTHGLTVVTRNTRDFPLVATHNPF